LIQSKSPKMRLDNLVGIGIISVALAGCGLDSDGNGAEVPEVNNPIFRIPRIIEKPIPEECKDSVEEDENYRDAMLRYARKWKLPGHFSKWMIKEGYGHYCRAFNVTNFVREEYDGKLRVGVYDTHMSMYSVLWENPQDQVDIMMEKLSLHFPGLEFEGEYLGEVEIEKLKKSDIPEEDFENFIFLGWDSSYNSGKYIFLHYPGILDHEFAHRLGYKHHDNEQFGEGYNMPFKTECTMDRNHNQLGPACLAAGGFPADSNNSEKLKELNKELSMFSSAMFKNRVSSAKVFGGILK
jgi:hypothetical protein